MFGTAQSFTDCGPLSNVITNFLDGTARNSLIMDPSMSSLEKSLISPLFFALDSQTRHSLGSNGKAKATQQLPDNFHACHQYLYRFGILIHLYICRYKTFLVSPSADIFLQASTEVTEKRGTGFLCGSGNGITLPGQKEHLFSDVHS